MDKKRESIYAYCVNGLMVERIGNVLTHGKAYLLEKDMIKDNGIEFINGYYFTNDRGKNQYFDSDQFKNHFEQILGVKPPKESIKRVALDVSCFENTAFKNLDKKEVAQVSIAHSNGAMTIPVKVYDYKKLDDGYYGFIVEVDGHIVNVAIHTERIPRLDDEGFYSGSNEAMRKAVDSLPQFGHLSHLKWQADREILAENLEAIQKEAQKQFDQFCDNLNKYIDMLNGEEKC